MGIVRFAKRAARESSKDLQPPLKITVKETRIDTEVRQSFFGLSKEQVQIRKEVEVEKEIVGEHWILECDDRHLERKWKSRLGGQIEHYTEGWNERYYLILLPTGKVIQICIYEEYMMRGWQMVNSEHKYSVHELDAALVELYDRKKVYYQHKSKEEFNNAICSTWGHAHQAGPIIRHAKGVGISLLLKGIL